MHMRPQKQWSGKEAMEAERVGGRGDESGEQEIDGQEGEGTQSRGEWDSTRKHGNEAETEEQGGRKKEMGGGDKKEMWRGGGGEHKRRKGEKEKKNERRVGSSEKGIQGGESGTPHTHLNFHRRSVTIYQHAAVHPPSGVAPAKKRMHELREQGENT